MTPVTGPQTAAINRNDNPAKLQHAAADFEALLIEQMLKAAQNPDGGGPGADGSQDSSSLMELGQQQFAQALANSGGLGIAKMVMAGLSKHANR